jgi:hypothetical protein
MRAAGGVVPEADGAAPGRRWAPKRGGRRWRDADVLKLGAGQSISRLGTCVTALTLPTAAIELLGAGPSRLARWLRSNRCRLRCSASRAGCWWIGCPAVRSMIACDLGRLAALGSIPLVYLWHGLSIYHLYAVVLLVGVFTPCSVVAAQC